MPQFKMGDRVRTVVDSEPVREGDFSPPAGTLGTVAILLKGGGYGVLIDGDPDRLPAHYTSDEIEYA